MKWGAVLVAAIGAATGEAFASANGAKDVALFAARKPEDGSKGGAERQRKRSEAGS